ncbi:20211_t:CDS:2, partial [Gigaspora margarita]
VLCSFGASSLWRFVFLLLRPFGAPFGASSFWCLCFIPLAFRHFWVSRLFGALLILVLCPFGA